MGRMGWQPWRPARNVTLDAHRRLFAAGQLYCHRVDAHQTVPRSELCRVGLLAAAPQADDPSPSVVLEGVDLGLTHREVLRELKKNADVLGIPETQLQAVTLTFSRFYRKSFAGTAEPTPNGRLIGLLAIISALTQRQGCFIGTSPVYARAYSRPSSSSIGSRRETVAPTNEQRQSGNRDKRTTDTRTHEEQNLMDTEDREAFEPNLPPAVRQKTTTVEPRITSPREADLSRTAWLQQLSLPPRRPQTT